MGEHVEIEIGVGRYEAFTIVRDEVTSSAHTTVAAALVWLRRHFIALSLSSESDVPGCTAAIGDIDGQEFVAQWHGSSDELTDLLHNLAD